MNTFPRPRLMVFLLVVALASAPVFAQDQIGLSSEFDQWVTDVMAQWQSPGVAIGAFVDGKGAVLKGYGFRDRENKLPVTPDTLMAIGSNSKSFTAVLAAQFVEAGELDWEKPVQHYLPDFKLKDEYATKNLTVKELFTHVSGLPRHDALWYGRSFTRPELFERLQYLEPSTTFRGRWQYQNLMYTTAGYLLERISGQSWDALVKERIFEPLGMRRSNTSVSDTPDSGDFAYPYNVSDGETEKVPFRNIDSVGPAGSINSSVQEMLLYVQARLNMGKDEEKSLVSADSEKFLQQPHSLPAANPMAPDYPETGPGTYGMALMISNYRGHRWVQHGGGIDGFISQMAWLPHDGIGVVVLTNGAGESGAVANIVTQRLFDELLGLEPVDWNGRTWEMFEKAKGMAEEQEKKRAEERVPDTKPTHDLKAYAGRFEHPAYGLAEVSKAGKNLKVEIDGFSTDLDHYHYNVFETREDDTPLGGVGLVSFHMNLQGEIDRIEIPLEPAVSPIVFDRVTDDE